LGWAVSVFLHPWMDSLSTWNYHPVVQMSG
jgi:hypothetical protein